MVRVSLQNGMIMSMVIPGTIAFIAILLAAPFFFDMVAVEQLVTKATKSVNAFDPNLQGPIVAAILAILAAIIYLIVVLLGLFLAIGAGFVEGKFLDTADARAIGVSDAQFENHWFRYIAHIDNTKNAYVSRVADFFAFELRTALALCPLELMLIAYHQWWACVVSGALILGLLKSAVIDHRWLSKYRNRTFGSDDDEVYDAKELVCRTVNKWCARLAHAPLALVLPKFQSDLNKEENVTAMCASLELARTLSDADVTPSEKNTLLRAQTAFEEVLRQSTSNRR